MNERMSEKRKEKEKKCKWKQKSIGNRRGNSGASECE